MELRPYQREAKEAIFEQWEHGTRKTLLVLPTGCGKTIVFAKVTEECVSRGDRVLILAHRGELLEQAADKIAKSRKPGLAGSRIIILTPSLSMKHITVFQTVTREF